MFGNTFHVVIVLAANLVNFFLGAVIGRIARLQRDHQVTCEYSSGMRSNGTALVVGLASFPNAPLVTVPAAIYIIFQHLLASIVKSRQAMRFGEIDTPQPVATGSSRLAASRAVVRPDKTIPSVLTSTGAR